jgi:hypothetical protein
MTCPICDTVLDIWECRQNTTVLEGGELVCERYVAWVLESNGIFSDEETIRMAQGGVSSDEESNEG